MVVFDQKISLRIAHLSDLHFSKISFSPLQIFSKRLLGNANLLFSRGRIFQPHKLIGLADFLSEARVDLVVISGDFSTTAREIEFAMALDFIDEISQRNIPVLTIPGNHDHYTKYAYKKKIFFDYFDNDALISSYPFNLKYHGIEVKLLGKNIYWIGLDTTLCTPWFSSFGVFNELQEEKLEFILNQLSKESLVILTNHYPPLPIKNKPQHSLLRSAPLCRLLKQFTNVRLYLHGHCHTYNLTDLREQNLPIILDSGSISHKYKPSFSLIDVSGSHVTIRKMYTKKLMKNAKWNVENKTDFLFNLVNN